MPPTRALFNTYFDVNFTTAAKPLNGLALVNYAPSYFYVCPGSAHAFFQLSLAFKAVGRGVLHVVEQRTQGGRDHGIEV